MFYCVAILSCKHKNNNGTLVVPLLFFIYNQTKGFEQGGSEAEENSPMDCFRRRGNERSEAIDAGASDKVPSYGPEKSTSSEVFFFFEYITFFVMYDCK